MEYEFLAEDGKRYIGNDAAPYSTPKVGDYIAVTVRRTISRNISSGYCAVEGANLNPVDRALFWIVL